MLGSENGNRFVKITVTTCMMLGCCLLFLGSRLVEKNNELREATESQQLYQSLYEDTVWESIELNSSLQALQAMYRVLLLKSLEFNSSMHTWEVRYRALLGSLLESREFSESGEESPFKVNITRLIGEGGEEGYELILRAEKLDIPSLLRIDPLDKRFAHPGDFDVPAFVNEDVVNYFVSSLEWFIDAWNSPDFPESGWLDYTATVMSFDCVINREGVNITVESLGNETWQALSHKSPL